MPYIAGYLLKLSVSLSVVYLFYILVLRRLTFYNWNRWYLLGYSLLAFFIPFVNISPVLQQSEWDKNLVIQLIPMFQGGGQVALPEQGFAWWTYLLMGAAAGMALMLVRFMVRYISYYRIRRSAQLLVDDEVKVYHVNKSIIPFSFGNAIFINRQLHAEEELQQIIHHEFIHVKQKHTIDILWAELMCMLNWYNPFAWLIKKAMRQNLEFIADNKVLENGIDKKHYQYLLLKVTGAAHFSITHQFNFDSLKKRIIMMNRSRSAKIQLTRFLFLLPLLSILLLAFRSNVIEQISLVDVTDQTPHNLKELLIEKIAAARDTLPKSAQPVNWKNKFLAKNPSVKNVAWLTEDLQSGSPSKIMVYRKDGTKEEYDWTNDEAKALFEKRYGMQPEGRPRVLVLAKDKSSEAVVADTMLNVLIDASRSGPGNPYLRVPPIQNILIVIDGVVQTGNKDLNDIEPGSIESINVLKGESAEKIYGEKAKGKEGVIEVNTKKKLTELQLSGEVLTYKKDSTVLKGNPTIKLRGSGAKNPPAGLYVVDGIEFSPAEFEKMDIDPERIESITILKDESAKLYGERGRNGVIVIALKKVLTLSEPWDSNRIRSMFKNSDQVIWVVNGNTYAVANNGTAFAMGQGIINSVVVNGELYTPAEANRLFRQDQFNSAGSIPAEAMLKVHGINAPALILSKGAGEYNKYRQSIKGHGRVSGR